MAGCVGAHGKRPLADHQTGVAGTAGNRDAGGWAVFFGTGPAEKSRWFEIERSELDARSLKRGMRR